MKWWMRILAIGIGVLVLVPLSFVAYGFLTFKDVSVYSGEAYGFLIGATHQETFRRALELKASGDIEEIHRWPKGESHFQFSETDLPEATLDSRWTMIVDTDWWNNSIRLEFQDSRLNEIHRFRVCCELP
jgi:hypothetical protein